MPLQSIEHSLTVGRPFYLQGGYVYGVYGENVTVHTFIVPGRARAVVSIILTGHLWVGCKPTGVIINAMAQSIGYLRAVFAFLRDTAAMAPSRDLHLSRWNINQ